MADNDKVEDASKFVYVFDETHSSTAFALEHPLRTEDLIIGARLADGTKVAFDRVTVQNDHLVLFERPSTGTFIEGLRIVLIG